MRIGELAKRSGLATSRIRFYEASGLLQSVERKTNGYRDYPPESLWILEIIAGAQNAGFALEEIRPLLPLPGNTWQHDELLTALKRKLVDIEGLQRRLEQSKAHLRLAIATIENNPDGVPCAVHSQRVLNRLRAEVAASMSDRAEAAPAATRESRKPANTAASAAASRRAARVAPTITPLRRKTAGTSRRAD